MFQTSGLGNTKVILLRNYPLFSLRRGSPGRTMSFTIHAVWMKYRCFKSPQPEVTGDLSTPIQTLKHWGENWKKTWKKQYRGEISDIHFILQSNGKVEVIYIQWTSVSKFFSISFCSPNGNWSFRVGNDLFTLFLNDVTLVIFYWPRTLFHFKLWERVWVSSHWLSRRFPLGCGQRIWSDQLCALQNCYQKLARLFKITFLGLILRFFLFISDSWSACLNANKSDYTQIAGDFKVNYYTKLNILENITSGYYEGSKTHRNLIYLFFISADYTSSSLKREYLNDDGENIWIRAYYRSYTRLHRYVLLFCLFVVTLSA